MEVRSLVCVEPIEALGLCTKNTARGRKIHKNLQVEVHYYKYVVSGFQVLTRRRFIGDGRRFAFRRSAKMQIVVQKQVELSPSWHTETDTTLQYCFVYWLRFMLIIIRLHATCLLLAVTCYNLAIFHQTGMQMVGFSFSPEVILIFRFSTKKELIGQIFRELFFLPRSKIICFEWVEKRNLIRSDMLSLFVPHPVSGVLLRCGTSSDVANTHVASFVYWRGKSRQTEVMTNARAKKKCKQCNRWAPAALKW